MSKYRITLHAREVLPYEMKLGGIDQPEVSAFEFATNDRETALVVAKWALKEVKPTEYPAPVPATEPIGHPQEAI